MEIYIGDKIKSLRLEKGISQEKLGQYLNVSFQSVSKWENGNAYPDISLLPEIARFFGITVDALLQVEKIDEEKLYTEFEQKAYDAFCKCSLAQDLAIWQEAYHALPNDPRVKEYLMSTYFDTDKVQYQKEIVELATELYNTCGEDAYYRGQAIEQLSRTYAAVGDVASAEKWACKAQLLMHAQEFLFAEITQGKELLSYFRFANYWYFKTLFYMACRICRDAELSHDGYGHTLFVLLAKLYDLVYPNGDADFEMLAILRTLHCSLAEDAAEQQNEALTCEHLNKALQFAQKAVTAKEHKLDAPLFKGMQTGDSPEDSKAALQFLKKHLASGAFDPYRNSDWFVKIEKHCT